MVNEKMRLLGAKRSCIRELFEYGLRRAAVVGKENVFDFSLGNPSVPAPRTLDETVASLIQGDTQALHSYTPAIGAPDTRRAVADELNRRYDCGAAAEDIFMTCGAAPALTAVLNALAGEDSEFVILAPYFPEYRVFIAAAGGRSVAVPVGDFRLSAERIAPYLSEKTQAVLVNTPNNPSGVVYTREELAALGRLLEEKGREFGHPIYLISDEPYRELVYEGLEVPFIPTIYPNTIVCYSYSKSLSIPGERLGYVYVPKQAAESRAVYEAVAGAGRALGHVCAPSLMQKALLECLSLRPDIETYDKNRRTMYEALTSYGYECIKPMGAFYMLIKSPDGDGETFSLRAKEKDVLIVPCRDFGAPEYLRISTCVSYDTVVRSLPLFKALIEER